jgi:hypothetical protein
MVDAAVQAALAKERRTSTPEAVPDTPVLGEVLAVYEDMAAFLTEDEDEAQRAPLPERRYYENNTVIQEKGVAVQEDGTDPAPAAARPRRGVPKLTPRQIRALRDKRHRGVSVPALIDEYGISRASVFRYLQSEKR